jgi:hypothetical protein
VSETTPPTIAETGETRPGSWKTFRTLARVAVPLLLLGGVARVYFAPYTFWDRFQLLVLACAAAVYIAVVVGRCRSRDVAAIVASILIGLATVEAYMVLKYRTSIDVNTRGYSVSIPVVGWGPAHPGVYHHTKTDIKSGRVVVDVDYTIDEHLNRKVDSASDAPTVAFAGGSAVFGSGVSDASTLPQAFADAIDRRLHVVNLAFSGYGAPQFLRMLETGVRDDALTRMRAFVFVSSLDLAERGACTRGYALRGPRYELVNGQVTFVGTCAEGWSLPLRLLFLATSLHDVIAPRFDDRTARQKLDLYVATLIRAGQLGREKYGAPTAILYMTDPVYAQTAGYTDAEIVGRLRAGGLIVIDGALDPAAFPGQDLFIPGDGHPTAVMNRAEAQRLKAGLASLLSPVP